MRFTKTLAASLFLAFSLGATGAAEARVHHKYYHGHRTSLKVEKQEVEVFADESFSVKQLRLLRFAREISKRDQHRHPSAFLGILMQETKAGTHDHYHVVHNGRSTYYGVGQIVIGTARAVIKEDPELAKRYGVTNRNLAQKLAFDDHFNIEVASRYLSMVERRSEAATIAAYNLGPGGVRGVRNLERFHYVRGVRHFQHQLSTQLVAI